MKSAEMKALLLRIGMDTGTDGALAPIFEDGSFEYIPISERCSSKESRTYGNTLGRSGKFLASYLPKNVKNRTIHFDPEFETFTYGDPTLKRKYLLGLERGDLLVFYAGLAHYPKDERNNALYIIGYFQVDNVIDFNSLSKGEAQDYSNMFNNNAHFKRNLDTTDLVLVTGDKSASSLLKRAILISQTKFDKVGKPYQAVSKEMEDLLGISGSIQRSLPPRFIRGGEHIDHLKNILQED